MGIWEGEGKDNNNTYIWDTLTYKLWKTEGIIARSIRVSRYENNVNIQQKRILLYLDELICANKYKYKWSN